MELLFFITLVQIPSTLQHLQTFAVLGNVLLTNQMHTVNKDQMKIIMTVQNVLTKAGLVLMEFNIVVQIHMMLATKNHLLICLFELKQPLLQLTNLTSHIQKQWKFVDT